MEGEGAYKALFRAWELLAINGTVNFLQECGTW